MTNRHESRKRAYHYVVDQAKKVNWDPPINSDERLADVFDISLDELRSLKKGLSDPSQKLVAEFRKLFGPATNEAEIDSYLVTPFLPKP